MEKAAIQIRDATSADLVAINDIYNHYVSRSTCTYQEIPETLSSRQEWFSSHGPEHPVTVAEMDGIIIGWGSLSSFRARSAYRFTVEDTVYIHPDFHRRGIGSALLGDLIHRAR